MKQLIISLWCVLAVALGASAQYTTGSWEVYPSYTSPTKLIDSPEYVYALSASSLHAYDKSTGELMALNTSNRLNGNRVTGAWYYPERKMLFIVYTDNNIDLLYEDGRTVNIADLRNAQIDMGTANDVAFKDNKAYMGTQKGLVVFDLDHGLVTESGQYGNNIYRVVATDSKLILRRINSGIIYVADRDGQHNTWDRFTQSKLTLNSYSDLYPLNGDKFITLRTNNGDNYCVSIVTVDSSKDNANCLTAEFTGRRSFDGALQHTSNGGYMSYTTADITYFDADGNVIKELTRSLPENISTLKIANYDASKPEQLWSANTDGIGLYDNAAGEFVIPMMRPNATSGTNVGQFIPSPDGRLFLATATLDASSLGGSLSANTTSAFDYLNESGQLESANIPGEKNLVDFVFNPKNTDEIVFCYVSKMYRYNLKTKERIEYNKSNSALGNITRVYSPKFDDEGNLYILQNLSSPKSRRILVVSASDWANGAPKESWKVIELEGVDLSHSSRLLPIDGKLFYTGNFMVGVVDLNGTPSDISDDRQYVSNCETDSDGLLISGSKSKQPKIDRNGMIWIPNSAGILVYDNINSAMEYNATPRRPKVPRNDGTSLADFLLDNVYALDIGIDSNNQKWVATEGSGLYRISADGTEILSHLTTENSDIPSDNVLAVYPDPNSNKVYVGTDQGLAVYYSSSSPAGEDYSNVYAYPNPVTPEYVGWVTITGLMEKSLVKIADANGRVFFEGRSDGGSLAWNGCDANGSRVKSGVYFVYASQNENDSSSAVVTKIVVVN